MNHRRGRITLVFLLVILVLQLDVQGQLKIMPLGNSVTRGSMCLNGNINNCDGLDDAEAIGYRKRLFDLMTGAGFNVDMVGSGKYGYSLMTDSDNAGFSGARDWDVASILETGSSGHTGQVTPGPYLNYYPADMILLHIGTNNVMSTDYTPNDVSRILDAIDAYETVTGEPILVFMAEIISSQNKPCGTDPGVVAYNNGLVSMAQSRISAGDHIVMVDMECGAGLDYYSDLIDQAHPNQTGYDKMADKWFEAINSYNTAPSVNVPSQSADRGSDFQTISLDSYVSDAEDLPQEMIWGFYPSSPVHFDISIDVNRVATIVPKDSNWSGSETIEFVATDQGRVITELQKMGSSLTQITVNWIPEIIGQQTLATAEGTPIEIAIEDLVLVEPEKAPADLSVVVLSGANYTFSGPIVTPNQGFSGTLSVPVKVMDHGKASNVFNVEIDVSSANHPPEITSLPVTSVNSGSTYNYQVVVNDPDPADVIIYSATQKPAWLEVNPSTGLVSGIPSRDDAGYQDVTIQVTDGEYVDDQNYSLQVIYSNQPPMITSVPNGQALVSQVYSYGLNATDPDGDPIGYFAKDIPDWLSFYPDSRVLIGVPGQDHVGESLVKMGATDFLDSTYQTYVLKVTLVSGMFQFEIEDLCRIYPNPVTQNLFIEMVDRAGLVGQDLIFELYDLTGSQVFQSILVEDHTEISLEGIGLANGMYFYRLTDVNIRDPLQSGKIVIKL